MATEEQIRECFEAMATNKGPAVSNIATVESVNEADATCVLIDEDEQKLFNVRLRPVLTGNKSFILVPKIKTLVLAIRIEDDDDWMVIACDEIEKIGWYVGNTIVELTDKVHIGANGKNLAKLIDKLFEAIDKMVFTTNAGPTINLVNKTEFDALKLEFKDLLI